MNLKPRTVELRHDGVKNSIHVPEHRVESYRARGWKRVHKKTSDATVAPDEPGQGTTTKEK